jgi:uncharacterized membrane protein
MRFFLAPGNGYPFSRFFGELVGLYPYADTGVTTTAAAQAVPIFVYGVYIVLGLGYLVCLVGLFFGKTPKDRSNAMELIKTLTAFYIGVVSGKFV